MGRGQFYIVMPVIAALSLAGCGFADTRSPVVPEFMRIKAHEPPPIEAPPDVKRLVAEKLDSVFTAASHPTRVQVSAPLHDLRRSMDCFASLAMTVFRSQTRIRDPAARFARAL